MPEKVAGRRFAFPSNDQKLESITLERGDGAATLVARFDGQERRIPFGKGSWKDGRLAWGRLPEQPAAASGGWTGGDTFAAKVVFYETPFQVSIKMTFSGDEVQVEAGPNVGFLPTGWTRLTGKAE